MHSEGRDRQERQRQALEVLTAALNRCQDEDVRTAEVFAALDLLAAGARETWPFDQFRRALDGYRDGDTGSAASARWQMVNASLNAVRRVVRLPARHPCSKLFPHRCVYRDERERCRSERAT